MPHRLVEKLETATRHAIARAGAVIAAVAVLATVGDGLTGDGSTRTGVLLVTTLVVGLATAMLFGDARHRFQRPLGATLLSMGILVFMFVAL